MGCCRLRCVSSAVQRMVFLGVLACIGCQSRDQAGEARRHAVGAVSSMQMAVQWLMKRQDPTGKWASAQGARNDVSCSALAALALMECGYGFQGKAMDCATGRALWLALKWLVGQQAPDGSFAHEQRMCVVDAVAATALGEYTMRAGSLVPWARRSFVRAIGFFRKREDEVLERADPALMAWCAWSDWLAANTGVDDAPTFRRRAAIALAGLAEGQDQGALLPHSAFAWWIVGRADSESSRGLLRTAGRIADAEGWQTRDSLGTMLTVRALATRRDEGSEQLNAIRQRIIAEQTRSGPDEGSWRPAATATGLEKERLWATATALWCLANPRWSEDEWGILSPPKPGVADEFD